MCHMSNFYYIYSRFHSTSQLKLLHVTLSIEWRVVAYRKMVN